MTPAAIELRDAICKGIKEAEADKATPVQASISGMAAGMAYLLRRIEQLEKSPLRYDGPHETGKSYDRGTFVTRGGSVWHANERTTTTPGDGPTWTLAVKHGKDAR